MKKLILTTSIFVFFTYFFAAQGSSAFSDIILRMGTLADDCYVTQRACDKMDQFLGMKDATAKSLELASLLFLAKRDTTCGNNKVKDFSLNLLREGAAKWLATLVWIGTLDVLTNKSVNHVISYVPIVRRYFGCSCDGACGRCLDRKKVLADVGAVISSFIFRYSVIPSLERKFS